MSILSKRKGITLSVNADVESIHENTNDDELLPIAQILTKNIINPQILQIALEMSRTIETNINNNPTTKGTLLELFGSKKKRPPQFDDSVQELDETAQPPDDSPVEITFHNRFFDNIIIKNHGVVHGFASKIFQHDGYIYKIILYDCSNIPTSILITELAMQQYSRIISTECKFKSPELLEYGKYILTKDEVNQLRNKGGLFRGETSENLFTCLFYFKMEKINFDTLHKTLGNDKFNNEDERRQLSGKINNIIDCMETNQLYHNDLNTNNILVDTSTNDIAIIDYGQASSDMRQLDAEFTSEKLAKLKKYSPTGGKTKKHKHKKSRAKKTHKKNAYKKHTKKTHKKIKNKNKK
jgi:serine/threonine protein kinase